MARSQPGHQRRRPGRRPPYRPSAGAFSGGPRPPGSVAAGMPARKSSTRSCRCKALEHAVSSTTTRPAGLVIGLGVGGAIVGSSWGVVGAVFGFAVGVTAGGIFVENRRYYRR